LNLQAGPYEWLTYEEAYNAAIQIGSAMRTRGVNPVIVLALLIN
jgi:long-chain acyl-CoA synthetase